MYVAHSNWRFEFLLTLVPVPFTLADEFDMLVPTRPAPPNEDITQILLFLRGNLAFFRNSPRVVDVFMRYEAVESLDKFFAWEGVSEDAGLPFPTFPNATATKLTRAPHRGD